MQHLATYARSKQAIRKRNVTSRSFRHRRSHSGPQWTALMRFADTFLDFQEVSGSASSKVAMPEMFVCPLGNYSCPIASTLNVSKRDLDALLGACLSASPQEGLLCRADGRQHGEWTPDRSASRTPICSRRDFVNRATIKKAMFPSYRTDSSMSATAASPVGSRRYRPLRCRS